MAIALYEKYVFRIGTLLAISLATMLIYFLNDDGLVWSYSGLLVGISFAISAVSGFKRFKPNLLTANAAIMQQIGNGNNSFKS